MKNVCNSCGEEIKEGGVGCDWRQGRCPHRSPMFNEIVKSKYKMRFYNLMKSIGNIFKKGDCDCGHKH